MKTDINKLIPIILLYYLKTVYMFKNSIIIKAVKVIVIISMNEFSNKYNVNNIINDP